MMATSTQETWQAFYSERAQREYYYHPKTNIVTWILPDETHPDGSSEPEEMDQHSRTNEIPRGLVFVDQPHVQKVTKRKRVLSANALTFVLLILATILTFIFGRLQQRENRYTPLGGRQGDIVQQVPQSSSEKESVLASSNERRQVLVQAEQTIQSQPTDTSTDDQELITVDNLDEERLEALKNRRRVFGVPRAPFEEESTADDDHVEEPELDQFEEKQTLEHQRTDEDPNSIVTTWTEALSTEPDQSDDSTEEALVSTDTDAQLARRGCLLPLAHLFSRKCRQTTKTRPLFDAQEFVDTMMQ
jgi:hypothetical protein